MSEPKQRITLLGATGSIGQTTARLLAQAPERFEVVALTAYDNVLGLVEMAKALRPAAAIIGKKEHYETLKETLTPLGIYVAAGENALVEAAQMPCDITVAGIVGAAGLRPTLAALAPKRRLLLANKECLVCAGEYFMQAVAEAGAELVPIDSEHNGLFQLLSGKNPRDVERVTITASGGPFLGKPTHSLTDVTPEQAVAHPNWKMGAKISVDSATLMNKGLELIEAFHLFSDFAPKQFGVVIHPQSIVHSLVEMRDGSTLAQLSQPDMAVPIAYGLAHPARMQTNTQRLNLAEAGTLEFLPADEADYPALRLAREAFAAGHNAPLALNAANEVAVKAFLAGQIKFTDILPLIERTLAGIPSIMLTSLETILGVDEDVRLRTQNLLQQAA